MAVRLLIVALGRLVWRCLYRWNCSLPDETTLRRVLCRPVRRFGLDQTWIIHPSAHTAIHWSHQKPIDLNPLKTYNFPWILRTQNSLPAENGVRQQRRSQPARVLLRRLPAIGWRPNINTLRCCLDQLTPLTDDQDVADRSDSTRDSSLQFSL